MEPSRGTKSGRSHADRRGRRLEGYFFSSRRRHTRFDCDWSSDVCSSDLPGITAREVDLDVVLSVLRERVTNRNSTTRADRESRYMLFLRDVGRDANDVALQDRKSVV